MTEQELIDYALKCIRGEEPVFELAHKIAQAREVRMEEVMFRQGMTRGGEVRRLLKEAETQALY